MGAICVIAACLTAMTGTAGQGTAGQPGNEAAVRELVAKYVDARQRSDGTAIRNLFTDDADQLTSSGEWRRGRDELVRGTLASSRANAGTRAITITTVRFPVPEVALADGEYTIGTGDGVRQMWTSFVMVRSSGGWRISAIRNMLPAPQRSGGR